MELAANPATEKPARLIETSFSNLPGWRQDNHGPAFRAFRRSALQAAVKPYRTGRLGAECAAFAEAFAAARSVAALDRAEARTFFERFFVPFRVEPEDGGSGFLTGYYEPETPASPVATEEFRVPIYGRPDDLVEIDEDDPPAGLEAGYRFARRVAGGWASYFDRQAIEEGALAGRGLEIAWLADAVDAFFIHVQGAARLMMADGTSRRIGYAAKSGHPFTAVGKVLADIGEIPRGEVTMQTIRAWFAAHPDRVDEILWRNRSFIFFREMPAGDPDAGPVAAAKVQLEPGRSLAVDRLLHTFATPFFIDAPGLSAIEPGPFRRLMIAQDTGSAIVGAARGDIFVGSGAAAGEIAGVIKNAGDFYVLLPAAGGRTT